MSVSTSLSLRILSPDGTILEKDQLVSISAPLADGGSIGIRPGHAPLIAETLRGAVRYQTTEEHYRIEVHPGVLEIREDTVVILTAGEVNQTPEDTLKPTDAEFIRLMQTIVGTLAPHPDNEDNQDQ